MPLASRSCDAVSYYADTNTSAESVLDAIYFESLEPALRRLLVATPFTSLADDEMRAALAAAPSSFVPTTLRRSAFELRVHILSALATQLEGEESDELRAYAFYVNAALDGHALATLALERGDDDEWASLVGARIHEGELPAFFDDVAACDFLYEFNKQEDEPLTPMAVLFSKCLPRRCKGRDFEVTLQQIVDSSDAMACALAALVLATRLGVYRHARPPTWAERLDVYRSLDSGARSIVASSNMMTVLREYMLFVVERYLPAHASFMRTDEWRAWAADIVASADALRSRTSRASSKIILQQPKDKTFACVLHAALRTQLDKGAAGTNSQAPAAALVTPEVVIVVRYLVSLVPAGLLEHLTLVLDADDIERAARERGELALGFAYASPLLIDAYGRASRTYAHTPSKKPVIAKILGKHDRYQLMLLYTLVTEVLARQRIRVAALPGYLVHAQRRTLVARFGGDVTTSMYFVCQHCMSFMGRATPENESSHAKPPVLGCDKVTMHSFCEDIEAAARIEQHGFPTYAQLQPQRTIHDYYVSQFRAEALRPSLVAARISSPERVRAHALAAERARALLASLFDDEVSLPLPQPSDGQIRWTCDSIVHKTARRRHNEHTRQTLGSAVTEREAKRDRTTYENRSRSYTRSYYELSRCRTRQLLAVDMLGCVLTVGSRSFIACTACLGITSLALAHWLGDGVLCSRCRRRADEGKAPMHELYASSATPTVVKCRCCSIKDNLRRYLVFDTTESLWLYYYFCGMHVREKEWLVESPTVLTRERVDYGIASLHRGRRYLGH